MFQFSKKAAAGSSAVVLLIAGGVGGLCAGLSHGLMPLNAVHNA